MTAARAACVRVVATIGLLVLAGCIDPQDRRPGLWLSGERSEPAADWSFTRAHPEVWIEVRTPYLLRHSVTIVCAERDGTLYVGARNPKEKRWVGYVERDPRVRIQIGEQLYELVLEDVEGEAEREAVYAAYAEKYGWPRAAPDERPYVRYWRALPTT